MDDEIAGVLVFLLIIVLALLGWGTISHLGAMNNGQHTGYVTAVEQEGLVWKTWRAYVKTDPMSSQEDSYCVTDPSVVSQLQDIETSRALVAVNYSSPYLVWNWQCGGEGSIINSVTISDPSASCDASGAIFSEEFQQKSIAAGDYIDSFLTPQFHFSQQMNACLSENGYNFPDHGGEGTYMQITNVDTGAPVLRSIPNENGSDFNASQGLVSYSDFMLQASGIMSN
jgi:hypothetical protein